MKYSIDYDNLEINLYITISLATREEFIIKKQNCIIVKYPY